MLKANSINNMFDKALPMMEPKQMPKGVITIYCKWQDNKQSHDWSNDGYHRRQDMAFQNTKCEERVI
jgi:hypothetical protein